MPPLASHGGSKPGAFLTSWTTMKNLKAGLSSSLKGSNVVPDGTMEPTSMAVSRANGLSSSGHPPYKQLVIQN